MPKRKRKEDDRILKKSKIDTQANSEAMEINNNNDTSPALESLGLSPAKMKNVPRLMNSKTIVDRVIADILIQPDEDSIRALFFEQIAIHRLDTVDIMLTLSSQLREALNEDGMSAIHIAAQTGDLKLFNLLLEKAAPENLVFEVQGEHGAPPENGLRGFVGCHDLFLQEGLVELDGTGRERVGTLRHLP